MKMSIDVEEMKKAMASGRVMTFAEIGQEMKISTQRVYQLYLQALGKVKDQTSEEEWEEILELLRDSRYNENLYDKMCDAFNQSLYCTEDWDLRGFWNARELCGEVTSPSPEERKRILQEKQKEGQE